MHKKTSGGGRAMKCSICGRKLTTPLSRELGYGPVCYRRKFGTYPSADHRKENRARGEDSDYNIPGQISMDDFLKTVSGE